jgi:hypothetical protein
MSLHKSAQALVCTSWSSLSCPSQKKAACRRPLMLAGRQLATGGNLPDGRLSGKLAGDRRYHPHRDDPAHRSMGRQQRADDGNSAQTQHRLLSTPASSRIAGMTSCIQRCSIACFWGATERSAGHFLLGPMVLHGDSPWCCMATARSRHQGTGTCTLGLAMHACACMTSGDAHTGPHDHLQAQ